MPLIRAVSALISGNFPSKKEKSLSGNQQPGEGFSLPASTMQAKKQHAGGKRRGYESEMEASHTGAAPVGGFLRRSSLRFWSQISFHSLEESALPLA